MYNGVYSMINRKFIEKKKKKIYTKNLLKKYVRAYLYPI